MMKNKLGIFNVTLGEMLGSPMGINNSRIKYEHQRDKSEHFIVMDKEQTFLDLLLGMFRNEKNVLNKFISVCNIC